MLDKYKKLAHEAQLNDDRVQAEYYLQFADHYFRVLADIKALKDEQRAKREGERDTDASDDRDDNDDDRQNAKGNDRNNDRGKPRRNSHSRDDAKNAPEKGHEGDDSDGGNGGDQDDGENPFTREAPKARTPRKPRAEKAASDKPRAAKPRKRAGAQEASGDGGSLDASMLPPAIARGGASEATDDTEEAPKAKKGLRPRRRPRDEDGEESLEAVG